MHVDRLKAELHTPWKAQNVATGRLDDKKAGAGKFGIVAREFQFVDFDSLPLWSPPPPPASPFAKWTKPSTTLKAIPMHNV